MLSLLGEIRKAGEIGYKGSGKFIWLPCIDCSQFRWTRIKVNRKPIFKRCQRCGSWKAKHGIGEQNPRWKGGRFKNWQGYIFVRLFEEDLFFSMIRKSYPYILEHRLVMAKHLGRCLHSWEVVHHKNGIKDDNRIENLELLPAPYKHDALTRLATRVKMLEGRVTLLEAENTLLRASQNLYREV